MTVVDIHFKILFVNIKEVSCQELIYKNLVPGYLLRYLEDHMFRSCLYPGKKDIFFWTVMDMNL